MCFFVQTNHTRKELLFLMFKEINLRNHSSLHKLFYSLGKRDYLTKSFKTEKEAKVWSTTLELQKAKGQAIAQQNTLFKDFYYLLMSNFVERMRLELITSTLPVSRSSQMS